MYKHTLLAFTLLLLLAACKLAKAPVEPLEIAQQIFSSHPPAHLEKYFKGDFTNPPSGKDFPTGTATRSLVLQQTPATAVIAIAVITKDGKGSDIYCYFTKDSTWKIHALRGLAMTGIIEGALQELEAMTPQQVDALIKQAENDRLATGLPFTSREDYNFKLGNARLTLAMDDSIIHHFQVNKAAFEKIKEAALQELQGKTSDGERAVQLATALKNDYRKLFIHNIDYGGYEPGGSCLNFAIGGMVDNSVGYLYVKDKKDLPDIDEDRVIMLREIGDGWYLYKTT